MANNGTLVGSPFYTNSATGFGNALAFGSSQSCTLGNPGPFNVSTTFAASASWMIEGRWAIPTPNNTYTVLGNSTSAAIKFTAAGTVSLSVPGVTTITTTQTINDGAWHWIIGACISGTPNTYFIIIDGIVRAKGTGTPSGLSNATSAFGNGTPMFVDEVLIRSGIQSGLTTSNVSGNTVYTTPTVPYLNNVANVVSLYHCDANVLDYANLVNLPLMGTISVVSSGGTDTITVPAPTAGDNAVSTITCLYGTSAGLEATNCTGSPYSGVGPATFTNPTGGASAPAFYVAYATDSSSNNSVNSNELVTGGSGNGLAKNFQMALTGGNPVSASGKIAQAMQTVGSNYYTMSATANPAQSKYLPIGSSWTIEAWAVANQDASTVRAFLGGGAGAITFQCTTYTGGTGGFAKASWEAISGTLNITGSTTVADGVTFHHWALCCAGPGTSNPGSASTITLYIDGVAVSSVTCVWFTPYNAQEFLAGFSGWIGKLDEMQFSTVAKYSGTFTPETTAYLNGTANQLALFHFDQTSFATQPQDTNGLIDLPTAPVASVVGSGGTDTISYTASTAGTNAIAGYSLYVGTTSGGESGTAYATNTGAGASSFTHPTATLFGVFYYIVKAFDNASTPNFSVASNEVFNANSGQQFYADNAAFTPSPYNTYLTGSGASANMLLISPGAYMKTTFTGQHCVLQFTTTNNVSPYPTIFVIIDGLPTRYVIQGTTNVTVPPLNYTYTHSLVILFDGANQSQDRWTTPVAAVNFTGMIIDTAGTLTPLPARRYYIAVFGDSRTEGYNDYAPGDATYSNSNFFSWCMKLADLMDAEIGVMAYIGQGWAQPAYGSHAPALSTTYNEYYNGISRTMTPAPNLIIFVMGYNDWMNSIVLATAEAAVTTVVGGLTASYPTAAMMMFDYYSASTNTNGNGVTMVTYWAGLTATALASNAKMHVVNASTWLATATDTFDGVHPVPGAQTGEIPLRIAAQAQPILNPSGSSASGGGNYVAQISSY